MDYDTIAKSYNELYIEEQLRKLNIIKKYLKIKKNHKLLDVGCGTGISTNFFDCKTFGIDKSKEMIEQGNGNLIQSLAEDLPFKDKYFDIVISVTSVHNFDNPKKALKEIQRVKKSKAQVVITLLNKSIKYNKIKELIKKYFEIISEIDEDKDTIFILR
ncbi:class I SAM-dependent methyltransferase [Candidatus Woesearchaeota archaeon]|nr:class I SAM-dependent methyltransferase [Candidatus Woesearchaeota archaeon]